MIGHILQDPCLHHKLPGSGRLLQPPAGRPCRLSPCPTVHKASEVALCLHLQGPYPAGPGDRQVFLVPSPQPGHGRGDRGQHGRGRGGHGRGRGQRGHGRGQQGRGSSAGGHETAQGQQLQVGLHTQVFLLVLVLSTGCHLGFMAPHLYSDTWGPVVELLVSQVCSKRASCESFGSSWLCLS